MALESRPSCCSRPDLQIESSSSREGALVRGGEEPDLPRAPSSWPWTCPTAPRPRRWRSAPGQRKASRPRCSRSGPPACRRRRRRRPPGARVRDAAARHRRGEGRGAMVARPPVAIVVDRMSVDDLAEVQEIERGELHHALAAARLPLRARDQPHGPLHRGPPRRPGRRLRRDVADGGRGPHHDLRGARGWRRQGVGERLLLALLALAEARGAPRRRWRFGPRIAPPGACTRSTVSRWSACGRATTATTTRTP